MGVAGVLFLTAGFGRRDEPLSLIRPKCLLPWGGSTLLGTLARQMKAAQPAAIRVNASRCPGDIEEEMEQVWPGGQCRLYFEERPLGSCATLARHGKRMCDGTWIVVNTDMVIPELEIVPMIEHHYRTGAHWTVLVGDFPAIGEYAPLVVGGNSEFSGSGLPRGSSSHEVHYWGVSIIEPAVTELAQELQISEGFFSELAKAAAERGMLLSAYRGAGEWIDMGRRESVRENILRAGNFIHPSACLSSDVSLKGRWHIGQGCILGGGTHLSDSVMLQGSTLESGSLVDGLLPWFCSSRDGAML